MTRDRKTRRRQPRAAFTLAELLVVFAVIALLLGALVPGLRRARQQARQVVCLSNQRQIGLAMLAYTHDYADSYPIAQYVDRVRRRWVAWDTSSRLDDPTSVEPGLLWTFSGYGAVQQCPSFRGASNTPGDRFSGYNYNTTFIGRGVDDRYQGMSAAPARTAELRSPGTTALVGDGGWRAGANKYMRSTLEPDENLAAAGSQAYRHRDRTGVTYGDGHAASVGTRFLRPNMSPWTEPQVGWPANGFLSPDDSAYDRQ